MHPIPGWLSGLIIVLLVVFLGWAALVPRHIEVNVTSEVWNETTAYYNEPVAIHHHGDGTVAPVPENGIDDEAP